MNFISRRIMKIKYLYDSITVFKEGYGLRSKIVLLCATITRSFLFIVSGFSFKRDDLVNKYLPDIMIKNKSGIYKCRKGSCDFWFAKDTWEVELTDYLSKKHTKVFVDVGANIGRYTIRMANKADKVISIEADPENFAALSENVHLNKLNNVSIINVACWKCTEKLKFFVSSMDMKGKSSIDGLAFNRTINIQGDTLDNILIQRGITEVDLIKIDVEGAEKEVLMGMSNIIKSNHNIEILFEDLDDRYISECRSILNKYGLVVSDKIFDGNMHLAKRG